MFSFFSILRNSNNIIVNPLPCYRNEVYAKPLGMSSIEPEHHPSAKSYDHINPTTTTTHTFQAPKMYDTKVYDTSKAFDKLYVAKEYNNKVTSLTQMETTNFETHEIKSYDKLYTTKTAIEPQIDDGTYEKCYEKTYKTLESIDSTSYDRQYDSAKVIEPVDSITYDKTVQPMETPTAISNTSSEKPTTINSSTSKKVLIPYVL